MFFSEHRLKMTSLRIGKHRIVKNIASLRKVNIAHPYPSGQPDRFFPVFFFITSLSFEKSYLFTSSVLKWKGLKRALKFRCTNPLFRFSLIPGTQQLLQTQAIHVQTNNQCNNIAQEAPCKCIQATLHSASCTAKIALQPLLHITVPSTK